MQHGLAVIIKWKGFGGAFLSLSKKGQYDFCYSYIVGKQSMVKQKGSYHHHASGKQTYSAGSSF